MPAPGPAVPEPFPGNAADITDEFVLQKCDYFTKVHLWPLKKDMNARIWLDNFEDHERRHARYLLNSFLYLSSTIIEQIVADSFESLSREVVLPSNDHAASEARWRTFVADLRVVIVRGEAPRPTDSGYIFSRIARDRLDISEAHILDLPDALEQLDAGLDAPLVFLDDFVGSGDQFTDTWNNAWPVNGRALSLASLCAGKQGPFVYSPVLMTEDGGTAINTNCPQVLLRPGHQLPSRSSVFHPESLVWPDDLRASATEFIEEASQRAQIPDTGGGEDDWRGYHELGLAVAFAHGIPDATIPLFWWESETWTPLKKRHREP